MKTLLFTLFVIIFIDVLKSDNITLSPKIKLNNNMEMPLVGFGTWKINFDRTFKLASFFNNHEKASTVIIDAIEVGYRHIDSAYFYDIERAIGIALKKVFSEGKVKREDLFITTKVWCNYHSRERVIKNIKISLAEMGIEYVDLALIHFPTGFKDGPVHFPIYFNNFTVIPRTWEQGAYLETWKGMEDAQRQGLAKSIGVANFNTDQLKKVLDSASIKPVINQVECNPYYNMNKMLDFCRQNNIVMTAYSPLREGKELLKDNVLIGIGQKYNKTAAQVALKWNIQRGVVVIPKTKRRNRMIENLNVFDFQLTMEDVIKINELKQRQKVVVIKQMRGHPDNPYL